MREGSATAQLVRTSPRPDGSLYITATLCMRSGEEVSGRVLIAALDALEASLIGEPNEAA